MNVLRGRSSGGSLVYFALLATLAGCSNQPAEILGPSPSSSGDVETRNVAAAVQEPPLPPISGWEPPRIRLWTDGGFRQTQDEGGVFAGEDRIWDVIVPDGESVTFQWSARPMNGRGKITGYRWALDIVDITDFTPRSGPGDLAHWSEWSLTEQSATVGPFTGLGGAPPLLCHDARPDRIPVDGHRAHPGIRGPADVELNLLHSKL